MATYRSEDNENLECLNSHDALTEVTHLAADTNGSGMQNNMHVGNGNPASLPNPKKQSCSLCESVAEAKYHCHWCQHHYCKRCQRCHDKLCGHPARQNSMALEDLQRRFNEICQIIPSLQTSNALLTQNDTKLASNHDKLSDETRSLTTESNAHKSEIQSLQQALMSLREENAGLNQSLEKLRMENSVLDQAVLSLRNEQVALNGTVGTLKKDNFYLQKAYEKLYPDVNQVVAAQQAGSSSQKSAALTDYDDSQVQADILQLQKHKMKVDSELQSMRSECNKVMGACSNALADYVPQVARLQAVVSRLEEEVKEMKKSSIATGFSAAAAAPEVHLPTLDNPGSSTYETTNNTTSFQFWGSDMKRRPSASSEEEEEEDDCPVCLAPITSPKALECGHKFCTDCIDRAIAVTPRCPKCQRRFGIQKGTQPQSGTMVHVVSRHSLPGYTGCGTITITYNFPSGRQEEGHPNPGRFYQGTQRMAYLPDNMEGREVLAMLYKAFYNRLIFTIGTSATTGATGVITWNDIHHKTNIHGGPFNFGYPDPEYLARVKLELADKGIFPS